MINKINNYSNYLFKLSLLFIILFISSDIFLTIELSGATVRFSYIIFFALFILWIVFILFTKNYFIPADRTYIPLFLFCFVSLISSLNSDFPLKSLIYSLWTIFSALTIVFLLWFSQNDGLNNLNWLFKVYFYSYFAVAIFGYYQFLLPFIIGDKTPLVRQWWVHDKLARINAFSFEPSYFATYMLMGCFIWFILWIRKNDIVNYKAVILAVIALIIFLSSSRIGWIGLLLIIAYGLIEVIGHYLINKRFTKQHAIFLIAFTVIVLLVAIVLIFIFNNPERFKFLFKGTGLFDTADFSYAMRSERALQTFRVFINKPGNVVFGVGPGGAGAYMVNSPEFKIYAADFKHIWATEPNNITAEILASTGIIGFASFAWFIILIFKRLWNLYKNNNLDLKYRTISLALFWGLIMEILILQFNQNYLRPYLWLHIGICIAASNILENHLKKKDLPFIPDEKF